MINFVDFTCLVVLSDFFSSATSSWMDALVVAREETAIGAAVVEKTAMGDWGRW